MKKEQIPLFKDVKGTTRNTMLIALYAAKPTDDESPDAQAMIALLNGLIVKLAELEQPEMEALSLPGSPTMLTKTLLNLNKGSLLRDRLFDCFFI